MEGKSASSANATNKPILRQLLPAEVVQAKPNAPTIRDVSTWTSVAARRKKKSSNTTACGNCRKRKSKCSGERPRCLRCTNLSLDCVYDTALVGETHTQALKRKYTELQEQKTAFEEIFKLIQTRSAKEADEIVERIRKGGNAESTLRSIKEGDLLLQLSLKPESRFRYEFPYIREMPQRLDYSNNPYINTLIFEWASEQKSNVKALESKKTRNNTSVYLKPCHAAEFVDPRLDAVKPSEWTTVAASDVIMRKMLASYFTFEFHWMPYMHKDYFLEDMATNQPRFCSSLLVNALLALCCVCHRELPNGSDFTNPQSLAFRFLAEARRLWELDSGKNKITTIQADIILTVIYGICGLDKLGWKYTIHALELADDLGLYDPDAREEDHDRQIVNDFTAWILYSFQGVIAYITFQTPHIKQRIQVPLPDPESNPSWYGEISVKYAMDHTLYPTGFGFLFKAKSELRVIITDIALQRFPDEHTRKTLSLQQVTVFYKRLKKWFDGLPYSLLPANIVYPGQILLHMQYNSVLINLFKEYANIELDEDTQESPSTIFSQAVIHFETICRIYYLRHGWESVQTCLMQFVVLLGYMCLDEIKATTDPERMKPIQATLLLVIKATMDQGRLYHIAKVLGRLLQNSMGPEEAKLLHHVADRVQLECDLEQVHMGDVHSSWPVKVVSVADDPETNRLSDLVDQYNAMNMAEGASQSSGVTSPVNTTDEERSSTQ